MTKTTNPDPTESGRRTDEPRQRKPYVRPHLKMLGKVSEVVRFPGGTLPAEGASGKAHRQ